MNNKIVFAKCLSLFIFFASCSKKDNPDNMRFPSMFEHISTTTTASAYRVSNNGVLSEITQEDYVQEIGGFEGYLMPDLIDSMQNSYRPAHRIHIKNIIELDVFGFKFLGEELDLLAQDIYINANKIEVNHDNSGDIFLMDINIITSLRLQINYIVYQYSKNSINLTRSPFFLGQFEQDGSLKIIADSIVSDEDLLPDDYLMVIKGEYIYDKIN